MDKEKLIRLANEHNMVGAITDELIQRFEENPVKLSTIAPYTFMRKFISDLEGIPLRNLPMSGRGLNSFWYSMMEQDMKQLPGIGCTSIYPHLDIFHRNESFGTTLITEDFVFYAINKISLRPGHMQDLARILTKNELRVPFDIPVMGPVQEEDKKQALRDALLKVAKAKPVAFTKVAKEELRVLGFDPKNFKKPEVMALLETIFD